MARYTTSEMKQFKGALQALERLVGRMKARRAATPNLEKAIKDLKGIIARFEGKGG